MAEPNDGAGEGVGKLRPDYYKVEVLADGGEKLTVVECFDLIDALAGGDFYLGNALKYIFRYGRKHPNGGQDIEKAITYLEQVLNRTPPRGR